MTEENTPLVSIIVPVYKTEEYLDQCIGSLVNQTYGNIEILLIDDGSPDNSHAICEKWQESDSRIRLYREENGGISRARNFGMDVASGDYILYVDSDDWISPSLIEMALGSLQKSGADMVLFRFVMVQSDGEVLHQKSEPFEGTLSPEDCLKLLLEHKVFSNHPWRYLYSKETAGIAFPENRVYEDMFVTYKRILKAKAVSCINDELYFYRVRDTGITGTFSYSSLEDLIDGLCERFDYVTECCPDLRSRAVYDKEYRLIRAFNRLMELDRSERSKADYQKLKDRICSEIKGLPVAPELKDRTKKKVRILQKFPAFAEFYCERILR